MSQIFTDDNFEKEVIEKSKTKPILVDFFAEWCGPCVAMGPILNELSEAIGDKAEIGKVDVDASRETATKYGIMSIPAIKIFKDGKVVDETMGLQPMENLKKMLEKHL
ncbi:thioredoxin [bacterium]|nr:thioredoxin [bacterium]